MFGLQLEKYPNITPPQVVVSASYPGASAAVIESSVASILETQVNGVENMLYMTSTSYDEAYQLNVFFKVGTNKDINLVNTQNRLKQAEPLLPEDVKRLGVTAVIQSSSATTVMVVGFVNSGMMTLRQAVWIIMGANISTIVTGLLIALDVGLIAPAVALIGVLFIGRNMIIILT